MLAHLLLAALVYAPAVRAAPPATPSAVPSQSQVRDEDLRWRLPLAEKAGIIQCDILARHWMEGLFINQVYLRTDGLPQTHTVLDIEGDEHESTWSGVYLMGLSFRYGWAKEHGTPEDVEAALDMGGQMLHGYDILTHVSGRPGMLARQILYGHGPVTEELEGSRDRNEWHQGVGKYRDFRYRANPSHHNYHHTIRGLSYWYYFLDKYSPNPTGRAKAQMDSVRALLVDLMDYGYKQRDGVVMDMDGTPSASLIWQGNEPETAGLMATNCLKFAAWITGDPWYRQRYEQLVEQYGYRRAGQVPPDRWQGSPGRLHTADHDDTEHVMGSLWLAYQVETDPQLKAFYRMAIASLFDSKRHDRWSFYNYIYASATGDTAGAELPGALATLRWFPSTSVTYPLMNSIRTDIEFTTNEDGQKVAKVPLPFNEVPLDGGGWKGDPYVIDGNTSVEVASLAVSQEDSLVWYVCDGRGWLIQSRDGGRTFIESSFQQNAAVRDATFAANKSRVALVATDKGIFRTERGGWRNSWQRVEVGTEGNKTPPQGGAARQIAVDPANPNVVWAVMDDGVWRSFDLGPEDVGKSWEKVAGSLPQDRNPIYGFATGPPPIVYAAAGGRLYRRAAGDAQWTYSPDLEGYHSFPAARQVAVSPVDPNTVFVVLTQTVWGTAMPLVLRTTDGGRTLTVVGVQRRSSSSVQSAGSGLERAQITSVTPDPVDRRFVYAASPKGMYRSTDGGTNWELANDGLRIPYAYRIMAPREIPGTIFCSTPAGLHVSTDRGRTWSRPILVLNERYLARREQGGYSYLVAYWPGRYFGYISDAEANRPAAQWGQ